MTLIKNDLNLEQQINQKVYLDLCYLDYICALGF